MADVTVYFTTNRVVQGPTTDWRSYGAEIVTPTDPAKITYAAAFVQGTDLGAEDSGAILSISHPRRVDFSPGSFRTSLARAKTSSFSFTGLPILF